ncbi:hypothetical protein TanjilG_30878 [Lupinus angustifolius]|uniref:Uncharacterized protein n=1 Tax=Lupinus angustifolius TaxID=3871 RepID=A0A394D9H6_LUPAN|nr:hypothetical protein TanjilG_30878 [Lupinus angustifolius]
MQDMVTSSTLVFEDDLVTEKKDETADPCHENKTAEIMNDIDDDTTSHTVAEGKEGDSNEISNSLETHGEWLTVTRPQLLILFIKERISQLMRIE